MEHADELLPLHLVWAAEMLWENTCDASTRHAEDPCQSKSLIHGNAALLSPFFFPLFY